MSLQASESDTFVRCGSDRKFDPNPKTLKLGLDFFDAVTLLFRTISKSYLNACTTDLLKLLVKPRHP